MFLAVDSWSSSYQSKIKLSCFKAVLDIFAEIGFWLTPLVSHEIMAEATIKPASTTDKNPQSPPTDSDHETFSDEKSIEKAPHEITFPEGGARAWGVAIGAAGVLFSTFGYANAFGYVILPRVPRSTQLY